MTVVLCIISSTPVPNLIWIHWKLALVTIEHENVFIASFPAMHQRIESGIDL